MAAPKSEVMKQRGNDVMILAHRITLASMINDALLFVETVG
jgi:hypothetical protein